MTALTFKPIADVLKDMVIPDFRSMEFSLARIASHLFLQEAAQLVNDLEALETPQWAADAIFKHEIMTRRVFDPNCGTGILAETARRHGYDVRSNDIFNWGYTHQNYTHDFLSPEATHHFGRWLNGATVIMNPPFKLAVPFIEKSIALRARKIVMFNTISFYTSLEREDFLARHRPTRIYIAGERATCWRFDEPERLRKGRATPKTFAFFVWDQFFSGNEPLLRVFYKPKKPKETSNDENSAS